MNVFLVINGRTMETKGVFMATAVATEYITLELKDKPLEQYYIKEVPILETLVDYKKDRAYNKLSSEERQLLGI